MLQALFTETLQPYTANDALIAQYWQELAQHYAEQSRHYHNLRHLENLLAHLQAVQADVSDWEAVVLAVFYHDAIYNTLRQDNEAKSAALAVQRLQAIGFPPGRAALVSDLILATKGHSVSSNPDVNCFTDADLAILGAPWEDYHTYTLQIRAEYSMYPDFLYRPGRKKVLTAFLNMARIYKTAYFWERYEARARENVERELAQLV